TSSLLSYVYCSHPTTTSIYTLSLHDALPISRDLTGVAQFAEAQTTQREAAVDGARTATTAAPRVRLHLELGLLLERLLVECFSRDRKSTRLNSSHEWISYAVFCLKKKNFYTF